MSASDRHVAVSACLAIEFVCVFSSAFSIKTEKFLGGVEGERERETEHGMPCKILEASSLAEKFTERPFPALIETTAV